MCADKLEIFKHRLQFLAILDKLRKYIVVRRGFSPASNFYRSNIKCVNT